MNRHQSNTSIKETEMVAESRKELKAAGNSGDPVERLRLLCLSRGASGILRLGRLFRRLDGDGSRRLTAGEFLEGLKEIGLHVTDEEAQDIFSKFDVDGSGSINVDEFLHAIRNLPESRKSVIDKAFIKMDKSGDGVITIDELKRAYNVRAHSMYISGEESKEDILKKFLDHFEEGSTQDRTVTKEEFLNYYSAISASVDNDGYFDLIIRQAYKL